MSWADDRGLKNRSAFSTTIDKKILERFDALAKETRIPKSKLIDEALLDLINKHNQKK